ncbi:antitoxin [Janibacter sp. UYMM211]|uniref:antitoxin n=1 Tax=Janibacter sp. UYMM211 TaxID=3156342 RepID=UPI00339B3077
MSIFDNAKDKAGELSEKHGDQIEEHSDTGLDTAGDFAEGKGLGADQVQQGRDAADGAIGTE